MNEWLTINAVQVQCGWRPVHTIDGPDGRKTWISVHNEYGLVALTYDSDSVLRHAVHIDADNPYGHGCYFGDDELRWVTGILQGRKLQSA